MLMMFCSVVSRGVAGRSLPGRQEVVALDFYWVAYKKLPMALDNMINSPMASMASSTEDSRMSRHLFMSSSMRLED